VAFIPRAYDDGEGRRRGGEPRSGEADTGKCVTLAHCGRRDIQLVRRSHAEPGDQGNGFVTVVAKARSAEGVGLLQEVVEVDTVEERPLRVRGVFARQLENRTEPPGATGADDEDTEAVRVVAILEDVVEADLLLPGIGVLVGSHAFGPIVEFDEEIELPAVSCVDLEHGVRVGDGPVHGQGECVLAVEVLEDDGTSVGRGERVDKELREAKGVVVTRDVYLGEVTLGGRNGVLAMEEAKAKQG